MRSLTFAENLEAVAALDRVTAEAWLACRRSGPADFLVPMPGGVEYRYRLLVESTTEGVVVLDGYRRIILRQHAVCVSWYGGSDMTLLGRALADLVHKCRCSPRAGRATSGRGGAARPRRRGALPRHHREHYVRYSLTLDATGRYAPPNAAFLAITGAAENAFARADPGD